MTKGIKGFQKGNKLWEGKHHSEKSKRKMRKAQKGERHPMYGKHHSIKTKEKISFTHRREKNPNWKDGKYKENGYIFILKPAHPFANNKGYVREHRLIIEKYINRYFTSEEIPHHINEIKDDNRIENLMAFVNQSAHIRFHKNPDNVKPEEIIFDGRKLNNGGD